MNWLENIINKKAHAIFIVFWGISILGTIVYKYNLSIRTFDHTQFTWVADFVFLILISTLAFARKHYLLPLSLIVLLIFKSIGSFSIYGEFSEKTDLYKEIVKTAVGYAFIFFVFSFLKTFNNEKLKKTQTFFKSLSLLVYALIFIGAGFSISFFKTYLGTRFGYSGFLYPSSYASYFVILSILIHYFYSIKIEKQSIVYLLLASIAGLFIGTKAVYLFLFLFWGIYFFKHKLYNYKTFWAFITVIIIAFVLFFDKIFTYLIEKFAVLFELFENNSILTFVLSYRDISFKNATTFISENWGFYNFIVGGVNRKELLIEMSFFDLILNFGLLGAILFISFYYFIIVKHIQRNTYIYLLLGSLLLITLLSGNFFDRLYLSYPLAFFFVIISKKQSKI